MENKAIVQMRDQSEKGIRPNSNLLLMRDTDHLSYSTQRLQNDFEMTCGLFAGT